MGDDGLSAGVVARRLGVAVTTLRTWHQRYGLGPSQHVPGHHRRYTPQDVARLEIMRRLTSEGVTPAEAARWAQRVPEVPDRELPWGRRRATIRPRDGGGLALPVDATTPAARGLARAALRLDAVGVCEAVERAIGADGVVGAWDGVVRPVLAGIGERHAATAGLVEVEHLLSRCVSQVLAVVARTAPRADPPRILLACADEEQHTLPLEALAAALAECGVATRQLGARVPVPALLEAVNRTGPAVVVLWSHARSTGDPDQLRAVLAARRRPPLLLAAGPGWPPEPLPAEAPPAGPLPAEPLPPGVLPPGVLRPTSLAEAVALTHTLPVDHALVSPDVPLLKG